MPNKLTIKWLVDKFNTNGHIDDLLHSGKAHAATTVTQWEKERALVVNWKIKKIISCSDFKQNNSGLY